MVPVSPQYQYPRSKFRAGCSLLQIFLPFVTNEVVDYLLSFFDGADLILGARTDASTLKTFELNNRMIYQKFAIEIRIIALQQKSTENAPIKKPLRRALEEATLHFGETVPGMNVLERLISRLLIPTDYYQKLNENFV